MTDSFTLPSADRFKELCQKRKLDKDQIWVLGNLLWRTHLKFMSSHKPSMDADERKQTLKLLKRVQVSLDQLLLSLGISGGDIATYSGPRPDSVETDLGRRATSRLMAAIAGREMLKQDPLRELVPYAAYASADLGDDLLKVKQSIDLIVDVTVKDRGGQPPDLVRNFLVRELCKVSQALIAKAPTSTARGAFAELVRDVLVDCCCLSDDGLEKLIERNVSLYKKTK